MEQKKREGGEVTKDMTVGEIACRLNLTCIAGTDGLMKEVKGVYIGDVLSVAMAHAREGELWITVQGHINAIAVAVLVNLPAIVLVHGVQVTQEVKNVAEEEGIALLSTNQRSYEMVSQLVKNL